MVQRWLFKGSPFGGEGATLKARSPSFAASEVRGLSVCKAMRCRRKNTQAEGWVQIDLGRALGNLWNPEPYLQLPVPPL